MIASPLQLGESNYALTGASNSNKAIPLVHHQKLVALADGQNHILELIAQGEPLETVLSDLALLIESHTSCKTFCAFLLLDRDGQRLRHGAAPSLPAAYNELIDGIEIGPQVGSCGTAAYHTASVIVEDIANDPLWAAFRDLALGFGLQACWSTPILSCDGRVLGTFAMYNPFPHRPHPQDRQLLIKATYLARIAIERYQTEMALKEANEDLERQVAHRTQALQSAISQLKQEMQERERIEEQLRQQAIELESAIQEIQRSQMWMIQSEKMSSLGQLVAGMAHEINNPVNFIHANLKHVKEYVESLFKWVNHVRSAAMGTSDRQTMISADLLDELDHDYDLPFIQEDLPKILSSMYVGTDRIRQIIVSLRNFSRMDEALYKSVNIHEGLDSTLSILEHRFKATPDRPAIEIHRHYNSIPDVECYAGHLNQVFMNLFSNAIDAIEDKYQLLQSTDRLDGFLGRIHIQTQLSADDTLEIEIIDNGIGISSEAQPKVFNPFFTTKPIGKGTGMGMSISYQIVTVQHNGRLSFSSVPGAGSRFKIVMPLRQPISEAEIGLT